MHHRGGVARRIGVLCAAAVVATWGLMALGAGTVGASTGGSISGKVTEASAPSVGIAGVCVFAYASTTALGTGTTNSAGTYTISNLPAGTYGVQFSTSQGCPKPTDANYATQWYDGAPLRNTPKFAFVTVASGKNTPTIDAAMIEGGSISGTVTVATTKAVLKTVCIQATPRAPDNGGITKPLTWGATTATNGTYTIANLSPTVAYDVIFTYCGTAPYGYVSQWFNDTASGAPWSSGASPVSVTSGEGTAVDAAMAPAGSISGTVTTRTSAATLSGICVRVTLPYSTLWISGSVTTGAHGTYTIKNLAPGSYDVEFDYSCWGNNGEFATQWWDGKWTQAAATAVAVTVGATRTGISAGLYKGAKISGKVTEASTASVGLAGICVNAGGWNTNTGPGGTYTLAGLPPGTYSVEFQSCGNSANYETQWWDDLSTPFPSTTPVSLTIGQARTGIDAAMYPGGAVSGTVTTATTKAPVPGICVSALNATTAAGKTFGASAWGTSTGAAGGYTVTGLAPGNWYLRFSNGCGNTTGDFTTQWYNGTATGAATESGAVGVKVTAGPAHSDINAAIADGLGTVTVSPNSATATAVDNTLTFTYTAPAGGISSGELELAVPLGWSAPSTTGTQDGYTVSGCGKLTVSGSDVELTGVSLSAKKTCTIVYGDKAGGGTGAKAQASPGTATFNALAGFAAGHSPTPIFDPPTLAVAAPAPPPPGGTGTRSVPLVTTTTSSTSAATLSGSTKSATVTVTVPKGALPTGTTITEYAVDTAAFTPPAGSTAFVVGFGFSWQTPKDKTPTATTPITMTIVDKSIKKTDLIYIVLADGKLSLVGKATQAGEATVTFTQDPVFLVASPVPSVTPATGYDLVGSDGGVFVFNAPGQTGGFYGSLPGLGVVPNKPVVGMVPTVTDTGYFLVAADGGVFAFTAPFLGSLPGLKVTPAQPITGIVAANTDKGYFLVGRDGGVFAFGTVPFLGSLPGDGISVDNIIGIASTPSGNGYWLVSSTGTVYGFGSAKSLGTAKGTASAVSAIAGTPTGGGYWITTENGTVYPFGVAKSFSTLPALHVTPVLPVIGIVHTAGTAGYWLLGSDGGIFAFGDAPFYGSLPGLTVHVTNIVGAVPN